MAFLFILNRLVWILLKLKTIVDLATVTEGQKSADIGSGDGRIVIALARLGAEAHGFEINPDLVIKAEQNIEQAGLKNKAIIHNQNYWEADLSNFDVITVYGITSMMLALEEKLQKELKSGAKVICNYFTFPNWPHQTKVGEVYLYTQQ